LCYELCQEHGIGSPALDRIMRLNDVSDLFSMKTRILCSPVIMPTW